MLQTGKLVLSAVALAALTSGAFAADLAMPSKKAPPMAAPVASDWDGAYIGANVGYAWAHSDNTTSSEGDMDMTGASVGAQLGYNMHVSDNIVLGIQGDINWADVTGNYEDNHIVDTIGWDGAVTARLGLDEGEFLPYILGGVAFANSLRTPSWTDADTETHVGWTAGVGVEAKIADNVSAFVEYRYSDYGQATYNYGDNPVVDLTSSAVRVGLNYHF